MDVIRPPTANTALSELVNLCAETELKARKIIDDYQAEGLHVSISTDIGGKKVSYLVWSCYFCSFVVAYLLFALCYKKSYFGFARASDR
jgi:hypothetical protein